MGFKDARSTWILPWLWLFALLLFSCQETKTISEKPLPPVVATSSVDQAVVAPDEEVEFTIVVDSDSSIHIIIPEVGERIKGLRILEYDATEKEEDHRIIKRRWYLLKADSAGSYLLPEIEIPYTTSQNEQKSVKTSAIFVEVVSPGSKPGEDILDIKSLYLIPQKWIWVVLGIAIGVFLLIMAGFFVRRRGKKEAKEEIQIPPHEMALTALDRLCAEWERGGLTPKRLHYALSDILRLYLEGQFKIPATDRTQEEIRMALKSESDINDLQKGLLMDILTQTDLVKFTDCTLQEEEHKRLLSLARLFVEQTAPAGVVTPAVGVPTVGHGEALTPVT